MDWKTYRFFLKFLAIIMGGSLFALGVVVIIGDPLNPKATRLSGDPVYDAVSDLVSVFGNTGTGVGIAVFGLFIGVVCYRAAKR